MRASIRSLCGNASALVVAFVLPMSPPVHAVTQRLDDSQSPRQRVESPIVKFNKTPYDDTSPTHADIRFGWVEYRLNTARYVGKSARIYYVVPMNIANLASPRGLRVDWKTRNGFAAGSARPGDRVLVWSGVVKSAMVEDSFDLSMTAELAYVRGRLGFESYFEIEVQ